MQLTAKFYVVEKTQYSHFVGGQVVLKPVTADTLENKAFWEATPSGRIEMQINRQASFEALELGSEYLITFEKVGEPSDATAIG